MRTSQSFYKILTSLFLGGLWISTSCGSNHQFSEPKIPVETAPLVRESEDATISDNTVPVTEDGAIITVPEKPVVVDPVIPPVVPPVVPPVIKDPTPVACSTLYQIPGIANPFLAGMPNGTEIAYPSSVDKAPVNSPILVTPTDKQCFEAGRLLYFRVEGKIAHGSMSDQESDADGIPTAPGSHTIGNMYNLSNLKAPINSLIGVFLNDSLPNDRPTAPPSLDFGVAGNRNFKTLAPRLGQIFFIGDGKDAAGALQSFTVPVGTTRLFLAIMDEYEWNNNLGKLSGGILWVKP